MQEVLAPFVIENLGCAGDEATLLDCPVAAVADGARGAERYLYDDQGPDGCAPFRASRTDSLAGSFAFVACSLGTAGVPPLNPPCSGLLTGTDRLRVVADAKSELARGLFLGVFLHCICGGDAAADVLWAIVALRPGSPARPHPESAKAADQNRPDCLPGVGELLAIQVLHQPAVPQQWLHISRRAVACSFPTSCNHAHAPAARPRSFHMHCLAKIWLSAPETSQWIQLRHH